MLYDPNWKPAETEIKLEDWQKILLKAAEILETEGWIQHYLRGENGFCAAGAIWQATTDHYNLRWHNNDHHAQRLYAKSREALERSIECIPAWNDEPQRTKEEVIQKLREVAHVV